MWGSGMSSGPLCDRLKYSAQVATWFVDYGPARIAKIALITKRLPADTCGKTAIDPTA